MTSRDCTIETTDRLNEIVNPVKWFLPVLVKRGDLGKRLIEAFGTDDKAFIAEKLGFASVQSIYKIIKGEQELDFEKLKKFRNYTKRSIDWLLTGEGETPKPQQKIVTIQEILENRIRAIAREEISAATRTIQNLGSVDEFDLDAAVERGDADREIIDAWYRHEGRRPPPDFLGFLAKTDYPATSEKRKAALRDVKKLLDRRVAHGQ